MNELPKLMRNLKDLPLADFLHMKSTLEQGGVFTPFRQYENFKRVYIDDCNNVAWDIDPNIDSNVVWNNKVDICSDSCYVDSVPL